MIGSSGGAEKEPNRDHGSASAIRVLLVDDEPSFAELTATFLERHVDQIETTTATGAEEVLETVTEFDCIVSDYDMPDITGLEFLRSVREGDEDLPFVLFTGKGSEEIAGEALSAGATDYLQKESGTDQYAVLANKVVNAVQKYRAERRIDRHARAMEAVNEGIAIVDADGCYVEMNDAYARLHGVEPAELIGEYWARTVSDAAKASLEAEAFAVIEAEGQWSGETVGQRVDGTTYPKLVSLTALDDGHVCVVRDITDRKERERQLKQERDRLADLADVVGSDLHEQLTVLEDHLQSVRVAYDSDHLDAAARTLEEIGTLVEDLNGELSDYRTDPLEA